MVVVAKTRVRVTPRVGQAVTLTFGLALSHPFWKCRRMVISVTCMGSSHNIGVPKECCSNSFGNCFFPQQI